MIHFSNGFLVVLSVDAYRRARIDTSSSRQTKNRFGEHLRNNGDMTHLDKQHEDDPDSNSSHQFNLPNHSADDMNILGLLCASTGSR